AALANAQDALTSSREIEGRPDLVVESLVLLAEIELKQGELSEAAHAARSAVELSADLGWPDSLQAMRVLGAIEIAMGVSSGVGRLEHVVKVGSAEGLRLDAARAHVALGSLDADPQSPHFHRAREIFAECGSERGLAELREAIAKVRTPAPA
ncbi:MAG: hypothetical protein ACREQY_22480, partial [Candidatus Binatia bacterium]